MKHPLPVVVGDGAAHAAAQQLQRLRLAENEGKEFVSIAQSPCRTMVAVDDRHSASAGQGHYDAGTESGWKMVSMFPIDACMLKPTLQRTTVYKIRDVAAAEFPRDANVEPERKYLVKLFARNVFSSDDGTARAVIVVAERKTTHEVTCGAECQHKESPANAGLNMGGELVMRRRGIARTQASVSERPRGWSRLPPLARVSSRYCRPSRGGPEWPASGRRRRSG